MNPELIPTSPITLARREKPAGSGRKLGTRNRISAQMREEVQAFLEEYGPSANPILINLRIAMNVEVSWAVRQKAAKDATSALLPRTLEIDRISSDESHGSASIIIQSLQTLLNGNDPAAPRLIQAQDSSEQENEQ